MPRSWLAVAATLLVMASACTSEAAEPRAGDLHVEVVADGLEHVWDIGFLPNGKALVSERPGRIGLLSGTAVTPVAADLGDVLVRGEGGLMGLAVHPDFATSRRFTTCQTHVEAGRPVDVRLVTWQLAADERSASRVVDPLVGGLPLNPSGRHSGCRPTLATDGTLLVGTGDTARATVAQDPTSLGGKILRVDLATGGPPPDNPNIAAPDPRTRLVLSLGHRNVQGIAVHPVTGVAYSAEHGPTTDDEVNRVVPGGNHGWDPAQGGTNPSGYDESVPMTDLERYPDAVRAAWSSGSPVEAISGMSFLVGPQWGELDGALAVAALRGEKLLLMTLDGTGAVSGVRIPAALDDTYGRLRAARQGPDGALYVTTSNGTNDKILRVTRA